MAKAAFAVVDFLRNGFGLGRRTMVTRDQLRWSLDLQEGIDFCLYLLGKFERRTLRACERFIKAGDVVLDIGANIGSHTLHFARLVGPEGRVIAFEPTDFAFKKLLTNVGLNPVLAPRITAEHAFLCAENTAQVPAQLYSSWPLHGSQDLHKKHCGRLMDADGARAVTLDEYIDRTGIDRVSFVKMDVDGREYSVLRGGKSLLMRHRPVVVMELAPYLLAETNRSVKDLIEFFESVGYRLFNLFSGHPLPKDPQSIEAIIRDGCSLNVVAKSS